MNDSSDTCLVGNQGHSTREDWIPEHKRTCTRMASNHDWNSRGDNTKYKATK